MTESDGDIEYLDEDAELVQQCVQGVQYMPEVDDKSTPLLVERVPREVVITRIPNERKRKRRKDEVDSDYDPSQDYLPASPASPKMKKRKPRIVKKVKTYHKASVPNLNVVKTKVFPAEEVGLDRKKCDIVIPDYEDPLCLPVKAIKHEDSDVKRLNNWNNVCLEHFKHCDNHLKPERGDTHKSSRNVVFRNVINKLSGKMETTIWSKTWVENVEGDRKSEIFQCVLPRYKEKKVLNTYSLSNRRPRSYHVTDEVILCKEESKDGEVLVVYKPKEATSSVFKLVAGKDSKPDQKDEWEEKEFDDEARKYMKELTYKNICAPCFQSSWRGVKKSEQRLIECPICGRTSATIYNLLLHFKTHSSEDVRKKKKIISAILSEIVEYHYKCRVCREKFTSIKKLRQHVTTHQGNKVFICEICNHIAS